VYEVHELVRRSEAVRVELAKTSAEVDRIGGDPSENMRLLWQSGLNRLNVPVKYGGLSTGAFSFAWDAALEVVTNLSAGEGGTGLNWLVQTGFTRILLSADSPLPESTREQLARAILEDGARLVGSNSEAGTGGAPVSARQIAGGVIVSGVKSFNTNSGGPRDRTYALVGLSLEGVRGRYQAVIPLNASGVLCHDDWDSMGQRSTMSGSITYDDVFVPDGWYCHQEIPPLVAGAGNGLGIGAVLLGIGLGAFDATVDYLRSVNRTITPGIASAVDDPILTMHLGDFSTKLAAAHALQRAVASDVETFTEGMDVGRLEVSCHRAKVADIDAALAVTSGIHELTGARSTANTYRLDRFWRNARTFSVHDPRDVRALWVGRYELQGQLPPPLESWTTHIGRSS
jgi:alkylation response protein AidB-like acyl-CoA dehydrogenase